MKPILIENGKRKVKIENDGYGLCFNTMKNGFQWTGFGFQWTGFPVDDELLHMMRDAIDQYFESEIKYGCYYDVDNSIHQGPHNQPYGKCIKDKCHIFSFYDTKDCPYWRPIK